MKALQSFPVSGNDPSETDCATDFATKSSENAQDWPTSLYANLNQNPCGFYCSHATFRNAVSVWNCHVSHASHAIFPIRVNQDDCLGVCCGRSDVRDQIAAQWAVMVQKQQAPP